MAQREAQGETEHVFYIAGATIVGVHAKGDYELWLLDYRKENPLVTAWQEGRPVPLDAYGGRIRLNVAYTVENPGPNREVHCIADTLMADENGLKYLSDECLSDDVWNYSKTPATVAVSKALWETIPVGTRPLPRTRDQDYRLRVVARQMTTGAVRYYLGFHVEVIEVGASPVVRFYSWENFELGEKSVDLAGDSVDPPSLGHTTIGIERALQVGDTGALFVAVDSFASEFPFLSGPKVPFGGDRGGDLVAKARAGRGFSRVTALREPPAVVISADHDDWLDDVRKTITTETMLMRDEASALEALTSWVATDRDEIELISHASGRHVLAVGEWRLTAGAFGAASEALRAGLHGKTLRIVGCATARGAVARAALCYLRKEFGLSVFGTRGLIGTPDLTTTGTDPAQRTSDFVAPPCGVAFEEADEYSVSEAELERGGTPGVFNDGDRDLVCGGLPEAIRTQITELGSALLRRRYFAYPGLLQLPSATTTFDVAGQLGGMLRVDSLFDGQLLRLVRTAPKLDRREYLFPMAASARAGLQAALGLRGIDAS